MEANALAGDDEINIPAGTFTLTIAGHSEDASVTGDLDITDNLTISGAGQNTTIIDGNSTDRIFDLVSRTSVEFIVNDLTVTNGNVLKEIGLEFDNDGGGNRSAIGDFNIVSLDRVTFSNNKAGRGSGVFLPGVQLEIANSRFGNNSGGRAVSAQGIIGIASSTFHDNTGGALSTSGSRVIVANSTFIANVTSGSGGAISTIADHITITNSTISGNTAGRSGGGLWLSRSVDHEIVNSTIVGNHAGEGGGIEAVLSSRVSVQNTLIANNTATSSGPDVNGTIISVGNNLVTNTSGSTGFGASGDLLNVPASLGPLANNGGPTQTHALLPGSLAIDAGINVLAVDADGNALLNDQRGTGFPRIINGTVDIGAFESAAAATVPELIGIDFGGGTTPTNWEQVNGTTTDFTTGALTDESGTITGITALIDFDSAPGNYFNFAPPAGDLPTHSQSLAGLDRAYADTGNLTVTFQGLTAGQDYELYVFGGDTFTDTQRTIITGATTLQFNSTHNANQLTVNSSVGSTANLDTFAVMMAADGSGNIEIRVDSSPGFAFGVAGLAIREASITPELSVSIDLASISENGGTATGTVTRNNGTSGSLAVNLSSDDTSEATVPTTVTIPDGSASATFTITAIDDAIADGTQTVTVTATATSFTDGSDTLEVTDDETPTLTLTVAPASMSENGGTAVGTVSRNNGTSGALVVTLASDDTSEATVPVTVTIPAGSSSATFTVTAVDDALADGTQTATITATVAGFTGDSDTVDVTDDETPTLTVTVAPASMSENGGTATGTVTRNTSTVGSLVVTLMSSDTGEATVPTTVTIADGATSATFTVTGVDDTIVDGTQTVTVTASAADLADGTNTVDVIDDESPSLTLLITPASISENGGAAIGTVTRNTPTTAALVVTLANSDTTEATVPMTVTIPVGSVSVTFAITGVDDAVVDGTQTVTVSASAADHTDGTDTLDVTDDDVAGLTVTIDMTSISENGGAAIGTVTRNTVTTVSLVVNLSSNDTSEATVPASVTIDDGNASATFAITAVDDTIADGTQTATITAAATGFFDGTDSIDVTDDELAALTVSIAPASISENGGVAIGTVTRNSSTEGALVVTLASNDTTEATVPMTVTIDDGATSATFAITGVDDTLIDGTQTVTITASSAGLSDGIRTLDVTDDDTPALSVSVSPTVISENGGVAVGTVSRNNGTTGDLIVTLASDDTTEATVPMTVTIPDGAASATFAVTGVDEAIADGTQTVSITATAASFTDGTDSVSVVDDETPPIRPSFWTISIRASGHRDSGLPAAAGIWGKFDTRTARTAAGSPFGRSPDFRPASITFLQRGGSPPSTPPTQRSPLKTRMKRSALQSSIRRFSQTTSPIRAFIGKISPQSH